MRDAFFNTLADNMHSNANIYFVTGDLGFGVTKPILEKAPLQFINAGIAEQNMMGFASGMALAGKTPFVYSIANFPTLRCLEQIRNDVCYYNANVKIIAIGEGFSYGSLGMSHHATEDIAIMRSLPNMIVFCPSDKYECKAITNYMCSHSGSMYMRLDRNGKSFHNEEISNFEVGKLYELISGNSAVTIISSGSITEEAMDVVCFFNKQGISLSLFSAPTIKPINIDSICEICKKTKLLISIEEHSVIGGLGSAIAEIISQFENKPILRIIGVNDTFASIVGNQEYLRDKYGLSSSAIILKIKEEVLKYK